MYDNHIDRSCIERSAIASAQGVGAPCARETSRSQLS
jgi:hypothetical protein